MQKRRQSTSLYAAVITVLTATSATAQTPKSYFCEVVKAYELSDSGVLQSSGGIDGRRKGERFQINMKTGEMTEMTGDYSFSSRSWARISVLDSGTSPDEGSFFKVMYSSPPDAKVVNVGYLEIQGTIEQPSRPFLYKYGPSMFSGVCSVAF
jgi:hypothetical protein